METKKNYTMKTPEEHFLYFKGFARISFCFVRKFLMPKFPEESAGALLKRTPIFHPCLNLRDTSTWQDNPVCIALRREADRCAAMEPEEFEETLWNYIRPEIERCAEITYDNATGIMVPPSWNCGSLKFDPPRMHPNTQPGWIHFHISNGVAPHSIFEDPEYLPLCFELLMRQTELKYGSHTLYTGSWLNDRAEWLAYFPQEWLDNRSPREEKPVPDWHFGWWGQLVNARGMINAKAEQFVRENGFLRYACRSSHCSFAALRAHLAGLKKQF